jgi:3-hydroxyacyl-CoA dehydrogenase / enoyl-CoA hydratase / 3-hydroxybutyryl-CoA epimerase
MSVELHATRFDVDADGIGVITLDVPGRSMNVLTPELMADLAALIAHIGAEPGIRGAIVTSGKASGFLAGADLNELLAICEPGLSAAAAMKISAELSSIFRRLETCGKPIVAAINGLALGGGLELCLACHHRILSDDPAAMLGCPEVKVGLLPGAGGTQRLPRLIGIPAALPLLLEGRHVKPAEARALGLVHALARPEELLNLARQWLLLAGPKAEQPWDVKGFQLPGGAGPLAPHASQTFVVGAALAAKGGGAHYPAPFAILSAVFEGTQLAIDGGLRVESKYFAKLLSGSVARNLMRTLFVNKGAADKRAARPAAGRKSAAARIGVIGAGLMGAGVAHVSARAGLTVVLLDSTRERAERGKANIAALRAKDLAKGSGTQAELEAVLNRITPTTEYTDLAEADVIVEAVFEDRSIKGEVIRQIEAAAKASALVATNTSTLPITGLAAAASRPQNFIGMHFFSPVEKMPLVEIIVGRSTSESSIARALDFAGQLRKTPIVVRDAPGFYTSRVFSTFVQEGLSMLDEGIAPALIENAAKSAGFPVGPLAVSDEVSLSLQQSILRQQELDQIPARFRIRAGSAVIDRMVDELKRPGRSAGGGFYDYPAQGPKKLWPGLGEVFARKGEQPDSVELQLRFLTIMALETARTIEDGVIMSASDADLGSVLGIGYPSWTGGTLSYIETVGIPAFVARCRTFCDRFGPRYTASPWLAGLAPGGHSVHRVPLPGRES